MICARALCGFFHVFAGKALVIFKSKAAADMALYDLDKRCLMVSDGR